MTLKKYTFTLFVKQIISKPLWNNLCLSRHALVELVSLKELVPIPTLLWMALGSVLLTLRFWHSKQRQSSNSLMRFKSIFNSQLELIIIRQKEHFSQKKSWYKLELCILALFHWTFVIDGFHGILSKKRSSTRRQGLLLNSLIMIGHPCNSLKCRHLGQLMT